MITTIRAARAKKGLSQMQVVEMTGGLINQYRLSVIERGLRPRPDEAVALAVVLEIPMGELLGELNLPIDLSYGMGRKPKRYFDNSKL